MLCLVAQSCLALCTPWTVACQAPLSMEFSRQEYVYPCILYIIFCYIFAIILPEISHKFLLSILLISFSLNVWYI